MSEKPILFSAPMVRAILDGRKTQTRRIMKPQPVGPVFIATDPKTPRYCLPYNETLTMGGLAMRCPYGQPGDRLWVRETWRYRDWTDDGEPEIEFLADGGSRLVFGHKIPPEWGDRLSDIWAGLSDPSNYAIDQRAADRRWRPAIHMPRWASRITLEITGIRVEMLQDISEADALAEGIDPKFPQDEQVANAAMMRYADIWESINGPGSWAANPWVWVVEFRRMK